jgi:cation:H+ antiporter
MISVFWLLFGGVLLYFGAEGLIRGAVAVAARAGLTPLVIGLTVVAAGTSMPEMVVSATGAIRGTTALAIGNVVGSNICNILLIGAVAALIRPMVVQRTTVRREIPLMIGASVLVAGLMLWGASLSRWEAGLLVALLIVNVAWTIRAARQDTPLAAGVEIPDVQAGSLGRSLLLGVLGLIGLVVGADRFVEGAVQIARVAGLSEAVIGLTIVAIGTSLPELATSVVAALKGESDIALGNVVGSNVFNLLGILGVSGLIRPLPVPAGTGIDLGVMLAASVVLLPLSRTGFRLERWEGALMLVGYVAYLVWLLMR